MANSLHLTSELKYRQFSRKLIYYGCFQLSTFVAPLLKPIFEICIGNVNTSAWKLPFNSATPFNMQTILGWLLTWFFQVNVSFSYGLSMILMTTDFIGSCYYISSICNHYELLINSMRPDAEQHMWSSVKAKVHRAIERNINIYE